MLLSRSRERTCLDARRRKDRPSRRGDRRLRRSAGVAPIHDTTAGAPIAVAQLLPLDRIEATADLAALWEDAPDAFLTKAEALGAAGFVESPLSLKLLRKAVAGGDDWPTRRYDLFE